MKDDNIFGQVAFDSDNFADNPEPRCPCMLLLDTSASMEGEPIAALNKGLQTFRSELFEDSLAMKRVEIAVVYPGHETEAGGIGSTFKCSHKGGDYHSTGRKSPALRLNGGEALHLSDQMNSSFHLWLR